MNLCLRLIAFISLLAILGCNNSTQNPKVSATSVKKETQPKKEMTPDTIHNYWAINKSIRPVKRNFEVLDKTYKLDLRTYSLNDSAQVRVFPKRTDNIVYVDHSHTMVTDIEVLVDSLRHYRQLTKIDFKPLLDNEFYSICSIYKSSLDSIVDGVLYLQTDLAVPDTDNQWRVWYSMDVAETKLDSLLFINVDYVGM